MFCVSDTNARACRVLLALVIPGHLIFIYTISFLKAGHTSITLIFSVMYLSAGMLQVGNIYLYAVIINYDQNSSNFSFHFKHSNKEF